MSCFTEVVSAFVGFEPLADVADGLDKGVEGSGRGLAQVGFELGEGHLDRVQVGGVLRQEQQ